MEKGKEKEQLIEVFNTLREKGNKLDWVSIECLRNNNEYSKTDHTKEYVLWEAEDDDIEISMISDKENKHEDLFNLFILDKEKKKVRFPFNTGDSSLRDSLSPFSYTDYKSGVKPQNKETLAKVKKFKEEYPYNYRKLMRWGTASRSCLVAIPISFDLEQMKECNELKRKSVEDFEVPINELQVALGGKAERFLDIIRPISKNLVEIEGKRYKIYSLKTGVNYVGNASQKIHGKNLLEANSEFAMSRSQVINEAEKTPDAKDNTFVIQKEILTITSKMNVSGTSRDGFQVRDLSEIDFVNENYLPCQAIPYISQAFTSGSVGADLDFWKRNFAYPCGRAKARLFLEYGLMQTSVNAQNFILAFLKSKQEHKTQISRFILRDIGDSFWHDTYVKDILGSKHKCYEAFKEEEANEFRHTLQGSSSASFPGPLMLRFGPGIVVNGHGFGTALEKQLQWKEEHVLKLGQEITNGFISYIREVGLLDLVLENNKPKKYKESSLNEILKIGNKFNYVGSKIEYTKEDVEEYRMKNEWSTLEGFNSIRKVIDKNVNKITTSAEILNAHTAEEICICLALENSLFSSSSKKRMLQRLLEKGNRLPDVVNYPQL